MMGAMIMVMVAIMMGDDHGNGGDYDGNDSDGSDSSI